MQLAESVRKTILELNSNKAIIWWSVQTLQTLQGFSDSHAFLIKSPSLETISLKMSPKEWWVEGKYWSRHWTRSCLSLKGSHPNGPFSVREPPCKHIYCIRCLSRDECGSVSAAEDTVLVQSGTKALACAATSVTVLPCEEEEPLKYLCISFGTPEPEKR